MHVLVKSYVKVLISRSKKNGDIIHLRPSFKKEEMKKAPDEVIARAIHDVLLKDHEKKK